MDKRTALQALGLDETASKEEIQAALAAKKQDVATKKASAPTDALKAKFETIEAKLADVEKALADSSAATPAVTPAQAGVQRPSPLSQTKLADLPGLAPQDAAQVELQSSQIIANRYEIKELIGQGGMGAVYRAFDKNRDEDIAIKVLLPSLTKNERALERFLNEARVSSKLSHQNIVNVFDVQNDGDLYFLIMELLEGQDLAQLILTREQLNQPFTARELTEVIEQLAPALDYAHQHTVHRDIKPENIWLDEDGHYKLMDFGIAQLQSTSQRTQTGAAMGTAYYMAPEQLKGSKNVDARADIYALGVMLYAMATGDVPAGLIKPLHEKRPDISPAFSNAVMQCLEADPAERPQSAGELLGFLQQGLTAKGGKIKKGTAARPATAAHLSSSPNKLVIVAVLLLVVGFGGAVGTGAIDLSGLMPMSKREAARQEAEIAQLKGEIETIEKQLDEGRRELESLYKEAKRNGDDVSAIEFWRQIVDESVFAKADIRELQGQISKAESFLSGNQYADSKPLYQAALDKYRSKLEFFSEREKIWRNESAVLINDRQKFSYGLAVLFSDTHLSGMNYPIDMGRSYAGLEDGFNGVAHRYTDEDMKKAADKKDTDKERWIAMLSYNIGYLLATDSKAKYDAVFIGDNGPDRVALLLGWRDVISRRSVEVSADETSAILEEMRKQKNMKTARENREFLHKNRDKEGVVETESGLQYKVIKSGEGDVSPGLNDEIRVHYEGKLLDGTVFDSSIARGEPVVFRLENTIQGWQEALPLMVEGDEWEVYVPSYLAYGETGVGSIPPEALLIFKIKLIAIEG